MFQCRCKTNFCSIKRYASIKLNWYHCSTDDLESKYMNVKRLRNNHIFRNYLTYNCFRQGNESGAIDVLHQVTVRGVKVKSLLSWRHIGFTPDAIAYREKDRLLAVCGTSDRMKTFRWES